MPFKMRQYRRLLAAVILLIAGTVAIGKWLSTGVQKVLEAVGQPTILDGKVKEIWTGPDGSLVALSESDSEIQIKVWSDKTLTKGGDPVVKAIDGHQLIGNNEPLSNSGYVVSGGAKYIAWLAAGKLMMGGISASNKAVVNPQAQDLQGHTVRSLAFLGDQLLIVFYTNGKLEAWNSASRAKGSAGSWVEGNWSIAAHGSILIISSFETGEFGLARFDGADYLDLKFDKLKFKDGSAIGVSPSGEIVVGTASGKLVKKDARTKEEKMLGYLGTNGQGIRKILFWDDETLIVMSKSGSTYAKLGRSSVISHLGFMPPADHICLIDQALAYSTAEDLEIVKLEVVVPLFRDRVFLFSTVLSLFSLFFTIWPTDLKKALRLGTPPS